MTKARIRTTTRASARSIMTRTTSTEDEPKIDHHLPQATATSDVDRSSSLELFLQPYLFHDYSEGDLRLLQFPAKKRRFYQMSDDDIKREFKGVGQVGNMIDNNKTSIWLLPPSEGVQGPQGHCEEWNDSGYFGNEAAYTEFYVKAVLRVRVPGWQARRSAGVENAILEDLGGSFVEEKENSEDIVFDGLCSPALESEYGGIAFTPPEERAAASSSRVAPPPPRAKAKAKAKAKAVAKAGAKKDTKKGGMKKPK